MLLWNECSNSIDIDTTEKQILSVSDLKRHWEFKWNLPERRETISAIVSLSIVSWSWKAFKVQADIWDFSYLFCNLLTYIPRWSRASAVLIGAIYGQSCSARKSKTSFLPQRLGLLSPPSPAPGPGPQRAQDRVTLINSTDTRRGTPMCPPWPSS